MLSRIFKPKRTASFDEDVLKQLVNYDVIILMDDSGSMLNSRWEQAGKVMKGVVKTAIEYDEDGIEIQFLNSMRCQVVKSKEEVRHLFGKVVPAGMTPLGVRLGEICDDYLGKLRDPTAKPKRRLIVVITDGAPTDKEQLCVTLKNTAKELDSLHTPLAQLGIQFVQIGRDRTATDFLKGLDNDLKGNKKDQVGRDIVDTFPYRGVELTSDELVKILVGAINRKVDNQTISRRR